MKNIEKLLKGGYQYQTNKCLKKIFKFEISDKYPPLCKKCYLKKNKND